MSSAKISLCEAWNFNVLLSISFMRTYASWVGPTSRPKRPTLPPECTLAIRLTARGAQNFQNYRGYLNLLGARTATWSQFHNGDPKTLCEIVENLVTTPTWRPRFVHPFSRHFAWLFSSLLSVWYRLRFLHGQSEPDREVDYPLYCRDLEYKEFGVHHPQRLQCVFLRPQGRFFLTHNLTERARKTMKHSPLFDWLIADRHSNKTQHINWR